MLPWAKITHLGDTSLMAPAALLIGLWLLAAHRPRLLYWWCTLLSIALLLVAGSKIAFIGWGLGIPALDFTGFSGHTTFAMAVFPVIAFLLLQHHAAWLRSSAIVLALMLGLLVGLSRLVLSAHSSSEVIAGYLLGAIVSIGFIWISRTASPTPLSRTLLAASLTLMLSASSLQAAPTQSLLTRIALYASGHEQPFVRSRPLVFAKGQRAIRLTGFRYAPQDAHKRGSKETLNHRDERRQEF